jgi:hypothetical protein
MSTLDGSQGRDEKRSNLAPSALLLLILLCLRLTVWNHPISVHGDEEQFIAALGFPADYPVHQPGYPAWVAMGTLLHRLGLAPYTAYQIWSLLASLAAPLLLRRILCHWVAPPLAWWTALGYGVNAIVWFHSVAALNYSLAAALSLWCISELLQEDPRSVYRGAKIAMVCIIFRPDALLWLGPIVLYMCWRRSRKSVFATASILLVGVAVSVLLSRWAYSHGVTQNASTTVMHTWQLLLRTSVFHLGFIDGLDRNVVKLGVLLTWSLGPFLPLLLAALIRRRTSRPVRNHALPILVIWILPALLFLLLIHMSEAGHVMPFLAPAYGLAAVLAESKWCNRKSILLFRVATILSIMQFSFYPWRAQTTGVARLINAKVAYLSASGLRQIDRRKDIHSPGDFWPTKAHTPQTPVK